MTLALPLMSRSGLEASQCGHRYKAIYVDGMTDDSEFSLRGTAFHGCRRRYVERLAAAQTQMDAEEAEHAFSEGIAECRTPPQLVAEVREVYDRHVQHFSLNLDAYVVAEQRHKRLDVPLPYQFEPDLVYAHHDQDILEIDDAKTYYVGFSEAQARRLVQTRYYIWAAMQEYPGFNTYRFTYSFVRLNKFTQVDFDRDDFDQLDREVHAMEEARRSRHTLNQWEAIPGDVCAFCQLACPVMDDEKRQRTRVNSEQSFQSVAGAVLVMEKALKEMKKGLKRYAVANGSQDVNGEVFDHFLSTARTYPGATVTDLIRQAGREPMFRVSASAIKADLKAQPKLENDLLTLERRKETARFGHKSVRSLEAAREDTDEDGDDE